MTPPTKLKKPRWTADEDRVLLSIIRTFDKATPIGQMLPAMRKALPGRPIGGIHTRLHRIDNAGRGRRYSADSIGIYTHLRELLYELGMVDTPTVSHWSIIIGTEHTKKRENLNTPGISKNAGNIVMNWRTDDQDDDYSLDWKRWTNETLTERFNAFRASLMHPPIELASVRRFRNGYLKRNAGYENGGTKLFRLYISLVEQHVCKAKINNVVSIAGAS